MRIVVTGREGQVVRSLVERGGQKGVEIAPLGRPGLDLGAGRDEIFAAVEAARPDVIVSAAAYTAVDKAEDEPDVAFAINSSGARALALAAFRLKVPIVHLSTDYVFDGAKSSPYVEIDATGPTGVYGASKLAGEKAVLAAHEDVAILRTAWVYSPFSANFVRTMLRLANERNEVAVVGDQFGNPTSALDIADGIIAVAGNLVERSDQALRGIFNMAGGLETTWAEFAEGVFRASAAVGGQTARVRTIDTSQFPTRARRPRNSRLSSEKLAEVHGVRLPGWQTSIVPIVERLVRGEDFVRNGA